MNRVLYLTGCLVFASSVSAEQWSVFDPIPRQPVPEVASKAWSAPIDAFVYSRMTEAGLTPAVEVDRRTWLRRVSYDLIGLPTSPDELQLFIRDQRSDAEAMRAVVDRLLASPRYGERWGRHWLDVVRYADSDGFAIDEERLTLWRYRDYVIRVFNEDRAFDQFIREQIAGDEIDSGVRGKIAISFYRLGPWEADNMTKERRRQDYLNDITSNVGSAFLGLTVGCARCHDHKFDPIQQSDFYQLQAFFTPMQHALITADFLPGEMNDEAKSRRDEIVRRRMTKQAELKDLRTALRRRIAKSRCVTADKISDEELQQVIDGNREPITKEESGRLAQLKKELENRKPEQRFENRVVAIRNPKDDETPTATFVLQNGDVFAPGQKVSPGFLSSVSGVAQDLVERASNSDQSSQGRRKLLAQWLTHPKNPITSRVLANRIWQYHFGAGIVATPNDFGANGSGPSHPKLLDYLARMLLDHNWKLKSIHRELVMSRTYRTSSRHAKAEQYAEIDPENRLLWRSNLRRLESETIRDAVLAVGGRLRFETGGPGFFETLPKGMKRSFPFFTWEPSSEEQRRRRSVYMFQRRNLVHPMMEAFDGADMNHSCERRGASVTAPQALTLFNSRFAHENSMYLAQRVQAFGSEIELRIKRLFGLALSRYPSEAELSKCLAFLRQKQESYSDRVAEKDSRAETETDTELFALRDLALAIINTNEFIYLD